MGGFIGRGRVLVVKFEEGGMSIFSMGLRAFSTVAKSLNFKVGCRCPVLSFCPPSNLSLLSSPGKIPSLPISSIRCHFLSLILRPPFFFISYSDDPTTSHRRRASAAAASLSRERQQPFRDRGDVLAAQARRRDGRNRSKYGRGPKCVLLREQYLCSGVG